MGKRGKGGSVADGGRARLRGRAWVFTVHTELGPSPEPLVAEEVGAGAVVSKVWRFWDPEAVAWDGDVVRYVVAGLETCPETGRFH